MPLVIAYKNKFRGIFSQKELAFNALKTIIQIDNDEVIAEEFLIISDSGRIRIGENRFTKLTYANMCKELREQTRIAIYDKTGINYIFAIWVTSMNEIFTHQNENKKEDENEENEE